MPESALPLESLMASAPCHTVSVKVVHTAEDLDFYVNDLEDLSRNLCVQNVYYEPWVISPLMHAFVENQDLVILLIFTGKDTGAQRLLGFFPLRRSRLHRAVPLPSLRLWQDPSFYFRTCDPLIRKGAAGACIGALLDWMRTDPASPAVLDLHGLTGGTDITCAIAHHLAADRSLIHAHTTHEGHFYRRQAAGADAYLKSTLSSDRRKSLRRSHRKLEELGRVDYVDIDQCDDVDAMLDAFFDLESGGWKGRNGTAIASRPGHRAVIEDIVRTAHQRGRLSLLGLRVDGRFIAMRTAFLSPPGSFLFKIGYDECDRYVRWSPGLLLELEAIRRLHSDGDLLGNDIEWLNCCAAPDSSMFRTTRSEAVPTERYVITVRGGVAARLITMLPHARSAYRKLLSQHQLLRRRFAASQSLSGRTASIIRACFRR